MLEEAKPKSMINPHFTFKRHVESSYHLSGKLCSIKLNVL